MSNKRANLMKTLSGVVAVIAALSVTACINLSAKSDEEPTTVLPPIGDFGAPTSDFKAVPTCDTDAPTIIYPANEDCRAWLHPTQECSNRVELTLKGIYPVIFPDPENVFELNKGVDYEICPVESLVTGIPKTAVTIIIESNHQGMGTAAEYQRSPAAQDNLDRFASKGGTVALHLATNAPPGYGYLAPGLFGSASEDGNSNFLTLVGTKGLLVDGPDGVAGTPDDLNNTNIQWTGGTYAHQGSLSGILPSNAEVLVTGNQNKPVYAQYKWGKGRIIATTTTLEFGEGLNFGGNYCCFGHGNRLMLNHLYHALNKPDPDEDKDGVPESKDCDDNDPLVREILLEDDFEEDVGTFNETVQLGDDPWAYANGHVNATGASQQALMANAEDWGDIRVTVKGSSGGTYGGCCVNGTTHRWRFGVVARGSLNGITDEGFHGYRCGLGSNAQPLNGIPHGGASTGQYVQIGSFLDAEEDNIRSECEGGLNTTFDQLARTDYDSFDFNDGGQVELNFWLVGDSLHCEATDGVNKVAAHAYDGEFTNGTVGLSTLNMFGQYDSIRVCRVLTTP